MTWTWNWRNFFLWEGKEEEVGGKFWGGVKYRPRTPRTSVKSIFV